MSGTERKGLWWAGPNDEWFQVGPHASREEVIAEARAYFDCSFHICEAETHPIKLSAERLIDAQYFENEDLFSCEDGPEPDRKAGAAEADEELQKLLDDWLNRHQHTFVQPTMFAWQANAEYIEHGEDE